jgi:hypothetical protein
MAYEAMFSTSSARRFSLASARDVYLSQQIGEPTIQDTGVEESLYTNI